MPREVARDELKRMLREINKSFSDMYDVEAEVARLIYKYCDWNRLRKKCKELVDLGI